MFTLARISRIVCCLLAVVALAFTAFCAWRGVSDYQMQVREGWKYRCGTVQVGMIFFALVGGGICAAGVIGYRKTTSWDHRLKIPPKDLTNR